MKTTQKSYFNTCIGELCFCLVYLYILPCTYNYLADVTFIQAMMEGRLESSESSSDSNSPYPASFKNTFWKELEAGRVNVFDNDMYSKVKKRSETISQSKESDISSVDEDNTIQIPKEKKRNLSDPVKRNNKRSSTVGSQKSKSTSKKKQPSKLHSDKKPGSSRCIVFSKIETDCDSEADVKSSQKATSTEINLKSNPKPMIKPDSSDEALMKPSLNLVIKKVPEITADMSTKCSVGSLAASPSYTVLPKSPDMINPGKLQEC